MNCKGVTGGDRVTYFCHCSISEIRLDGHLAVDTSCGSQYGSRGALAWTPPTSVEGSTPTWTEGTPSFTESSSSGEIGTLFIWYLYFCKHIYVFHPNYVEISSNSSPLNTSTSDRHKPTVEEALNSLTSEMVSRNVIPITTTKKD